MQNVLSEIIEWASELEYWEQAALDKIISGVTFTDEDYDELLQYLLEDAQLRDRTRKRKMLSMSQGDYQASAEARPTLLLEITNLNNVNALIPNQRLTFGKQLTAIFGRNGSGKSGYARVLGCAGFTRGDREVLPDVTQPIKSQEEVSADVLVSDGEAEKWIHYRVGQRCPDLGSFYVFDSTSVQTHMCGKNTFSFSPAGLSILKTLATVTDEVRNRLNIQIREKTEPLNFELYFSGESEIKELVKSINADSVLDELKSISELSTTENKRIHELNLEISNIALEKTQEEIEKLEEHIQQLTDLYECLERTCQQLSETNLCDIDQLISDYKLSFQKAQQLSADQFHHPRLKQTGGDVWNRFILSAKKLAEAESTPSHPYPQKGEPCLLCHQPLSSEANTLILDLWEYLGGEAKDQLARTDILLMDKLNLLNARQSYNISDDLEPPISILAKYDNEIALYIQKLVDTLRKRKDRVETAILLKKNIGTLSELPQNNIRYILKIVDRLKWKLQELKNQNQTEEIKKREDEKRVLEHRKQLGELIPQIQEHIISLTWAREAGKVIGSTYHITKKHNQLFDELVKNRYITLFKQTLEDLGRPIKVKIQTSGRKGETLKQIVLEADQSALSIAQPEKVLSEGEKRAVALADFLTEVALDTTSSGIILDDPVTSLDLEWRETIACILAIEAKKRQVIVFTHDMPFLYQLISLAEKESVNSVVHWIRRGDLDNRPGYVHLNNCPALEKEYRKSARARYFYEQALKSPAEIQEALVKEGMAALRTSYEAFIVFDLFNGVVMRFEENIRFSLLKDVYWDPSIANEVVENYGHISRFIEGHLHSDVFVTSLTPKLLLEEIDKYEGLRRRQKELRSA